jgi:hypothetical protein
MEMEALKKSAVYIWYQQFKNDQDSPAATSRNDENSQSYDIRSACDD